MSSLLKPTQAASSSSVASRREAAVWAIWPGEGSVKMCEAMAVRRVRARLTGSRGVSFWRSVRVMGWSRGTSLAVVGGKGWVVSLISSERLY